MLLHHITGYAFLSYLCCAMNAYLLYPVMYCKFHRNHYGIVSLCYLLSYLKHLNNLFTPAKCLVAMHLRRKNLLACGAGMLKSEMKQIKAK